MIARLGFVAAALLVLLAAAALWSQVWGFDVRQAAHWQWLGAYVRERGSLPEWLLWSLYGVAAALMAAMLAVKAILSRLIESGHGTLHGSARWAKRGDVKKAGLWRERGVVVGGWPSPLRRRTKSLRDDGPEHILAFAPPRSGKGVALVIPTLLSWSGSVIVHDIRGENFAKTAGWRADRGDVVLKFDPTATAEGGSIRWNPLSEVRIRTPHEIADAQNISIMIIDPDGKGLTDFWQKSAFAWLSAAILHTLYKVDDREKRTATLADVQTLLSALEEQGLENLLHDMEGYDHGGREAVNAMVHQAAREMIDRAAQERSGVQSSAKIDLTLYRDPIIAKNISASDFKITDFLQGDKPISLYLVVPPSDIDRLRPLLRVFWNLLLRRLMESYDAGAAVGYKRQLLLMFDEFTSVKKLDVFEQSMAFMGGYGIKAYLIVQNLMQIEAVYGKDSPLLGLCKTKIAFAPNDVGTAKILSDLCGTTTVVQRKRSRSGQVTDPFGNLSTSIAETRRPLLTPDECMRLRAAKKSRRDPAKIVKPGAMLTFVAGSVPILGQQPLYFLDAELSKRAALPPPAMKQDDGGAKEEAAPEPALPPEPDTPAERLRAAAAQL